MHGPASMLQAAPGVGAGSHFPSTSHTPFMHGPALQAAPATGTGTQVPAASHSPAMHGFSLALQVAPGVGTSAQDPVLSQTPVRHGCVPAEQGAPGVGTPAHEPAPSHSQVLHAPLPAQWNPAGWATLAQTPLLQKSSVQGLESSQDLPRHDDATPPSGAWAQCRSVSCQQVSLAPQPSIVQLSPSSHAFASYGARSQPFAVQTYVAQPRMPAHDAPLHTPAGPHRSSVVHGSPSSQV